MLLHRCSLLTTLAAGLVSILAPSSLMAADPLPRCAIIVSQSEPAGNVVADLLAVELVAKGYPVVDRENLHRTLGEQVLVQAFEAGRTAARQKVGRIAGADLLIFLTMRDNEESKAIEWSVASMPAGLRLSKGGAPWGETHLDESLVAMMASVNRAAALAASESIKIVCVSPFICRDAAYEQISKQSTYKKLAEDLLMQVPDVVVVEVDEVESLIRESQLVPDLPKFDAPLFLLGEYMTSSTESNPSTTLAVELRKSAMSFGRRQFAASGDDKLKVALNSALAELLEEDEAKQNSMQSREDSEALAAHALTLVRMGARKDALPLLKIAALWDPDNHEIRRLVFVTLKNMVSSASGAPRGLQSPLHQMDLMEQTLDAFEDMVRRRTINLQDLYALAGFRGNGYLSDVRRLDREFPGIAARICALDTRYRGTLRDTLGGKYGPIDAELRDHALMMLVFQMYSDKWRSIDPAHDESIELLHSLVNTPGDEHHVVQMFLYHNSDHTRKSSRFKQFWQECCSPDHERLNALRDIAERIRGLQSRDDRHAFDLLLEESRINLRLSNVAVQKIRLMADTCLGEALAESGHESTLTAPSLPMLKEIPGAPTRIMNWVVAHPGKIEFIATQSAIFRVSVDHTFSKIHEGRHPRIAWDSKYLWIGTTTALLVADQTGHILAQEDLAGYKSLGVFASGKVLVRRANTSAEGGRRTAHEIWTLNTNGLPKLEGELVRIEDGNVNNDLNLPDPRARNRTAQPGFDRLLPKVAEGKVPDVFSIARANGLHLNPYEYRPGTMYEWPRMAHCLEHEGAYYLLPAYTTMKGGARRHAIFKADSPQDTPQMVVDFGWQRCGGRYGYWSMSTESSTSSAVVRGEWLHYLRNYEDCPPQWGAYNLVTGDSRAIVADVGRDLKVDARRLVNSTLFGLLLVANMNPYQVELPPSTTWLTYNEAVDSLRFPDEQLPKEDGKLWSTK